MRKLLGYTLLALLTVTLVGCKWGSDRGVKFGDIGDNGEIGPKSLTSSYATYQITDSCTTGRLSFETEKESDTLAKFCNALSDDTANNNCARPYRYRLFTAQCQGMNWVGDRPFIPNNFYEDQYEFKTSTCSTGIHFIQGSTAEAVKADLCSIVLNDTLNRNCARNEREQLHLSNCTL